MGEALDMVHGSTLGPDRRRLLSDSVAWLKDALGLSPKDPALFERALTHGSRAKASYERLEFLGDRVLGLLIAELLYARFPDEPEGKMSFRLNTLVARTACAEVGRAMGLSARVRLGKQALDDGAYDSDNVLGDVVEALIGALYLDQGLDAARAFVERYWSEKVSGQTKAPRHPKSALQEWAAAHNRRPPDYQLVERSGPDHAPRFRVKVLVGKLAEAEAEGASLQAAQTAAAAALLDQLGG
jgi:ribonuclease-3